MKDIYCNVCGKKLFVEKGILKEDAFEAKKQWGYFSKKDGMLHSFVICEKCYDDIAFNKKIKPVRGITDYERVMDMFFTDLFDGVIAKITWELPNE